MGVDPLKYTMEVNVMTPRRRPTPTIPLPSPPHPSFNLFPHLLKHISMIKNAPELF